MTRSEIATFDLPPWPMIEPDSESTPRLVDFVIRLLYSLREYHSIRLPLSVMYTRGALEFCGLYGLPERDWGEDEQDAWIKGLVRYLEIRFL